MGTEVPVLEVGSPTTNPQELSSAKGQPYLFADVIEVQASAQTHGAWSTWDESMQRWRLELLSPKATSLNLHFKAFHLPEGARLTIFNPDNPRALVELSDKDNKAHGQYWTPQFSGNRVQLDLIIPPAVKDQLKLTLGTVNAGFR